MDEGSKEQVIDVGGGWGEYFVKRARGKPEKNFLIFEPRPLKLRKKPPNLEIVRWQSTKESGLPLDQFSVDEANINFLYGEIHYGESEEDTVKMADDAEERYARLLSQLKLVLKENGCLVIVDASGFMPFIERILKEEGYSIESGPEPLSDPNTTQWSTIHGEKWKKGIDFARPMKLEAVIIRKRSSCFN